MKVAEEDGKLIIIDDTDNFDVASFRDSVTKALKEHKFTDALEKHNFLLKICKAFGFSTEAFKDVQIEEEYVLDSLDDLVDGADKEISLMEIKVM